MAGRPNPEAQEAASNPDLQSENADGHGDVVSNNQKIGGKPGDPAHIESDRVDHTDPLPGQIGGNAAAGGAAPIGPGADHPHPVGDGVIGNNDPSEKANDAILGADRGGDKRADKPVQADMGSKAPDTAPGNDTAASAAGGGLAGGPDGDGKSWLDQAKERQQSLKDENERLNRPAGTEYAEDDGSGNVVERKAKDPADDLKMMDDETDEAFQRRVARARQEAIRAPLPQQRTRGVIPR